MGTATANEKPASVGERGGIQSLLRASSILDAVSQHPEGISLSQLSLAVGLHVSTTSHLVKTLAGLGLIAQNAENKRYRIGSRLFALAAGALDENALLTEGMPVLESLSAATGEAAHLAVRSGGEIVVVARTAATGMLQPSVRTGSTRPAHATAIGKMLFASIPDEELDRLLARLALDAFTANTITSKEGLRTELAEVRREGIAHDRGEFDADLRCVALPVHDFAGRCIAAIGISGPVWYMAEEALEKKVEALRAAAGDLSARLGHRA